MGSNLADVSTMTNHLWFLEHGNIVDHTSPAMRTPINPFPADMEWSLLQRTPQWRNDPKFCCMTLLATEWSLLQWTPYDELSMGGKRRNCPFPLIFRHPAGGDQAMAIGNMHKNWVKTVHVVPQIRWQSDWQTHTHDVLITILRHCSHGRSNYSNWWLALCSAVWATSEHTLTQICQV